MSAQPFFDTADDALVNSLVEQEDKDSILLVTSDYEL